MSASGPDVVALTPAAARESLFGEILDLDDLRPVAFLPGGVGEAALQSFATQGEALLRSLAVIDDGAPRSDDPEAPVDPALVRIDAKLDVLTLLVANLTAASDPDQPHALQWSARGAEVLFDEAFAVGTVGRFRVKPSEGLPTKLVLPAVVIATEPDGHCTRTWLRFEPLSASLEAALERHIFRIHRRAVAESRRPR